MELEKFDPVCVAVLKKTEIEKPAYPVIDFHMHMGKRLGCLISRKNYCVSIFHTAQIHPAGFVHVQKRHLIMSLQVAIFGLTCVCTIRK